MNRYGSSLISKRARCKFPVNLQFFAEGDGNGGGAGGGSGTGDAGGAAGGEGDNPAAGAGSEGDQGGTQSFDDILKNPAFQSEFDKRVAKALETQRTKLSADFEKKIEDTKTEAEKFAKMNADQKAQYEKEKKEAELAKRESEITKRELTATAKETLAEKGLPTSLSSVLDYTDAEKCTASIEAVEKAFKEAVEKAVDERLKGGKPPHKAGAENSALEEEIMKAMKG